MKRSTFIQFWILSGITLLNFVAQIFYYFRLYYVPRHLLADLGRALVGPLGWVFALFLAALILLVRKSRIGYSLMLLFLTFEFLFYLWNIVGGAVHGYGWFFHLADPDPVLWTVFAIGYLNFFVAAYFLVLLFLKRRELVGVPA